MKEKADLNGTMTRRVLASGLALQYAAGANLLEGKPVAPGAALSLGSRDLAIVEESAPAGEVENGVVTAER